ncbi:hypothetical protein GQ43DRAFT_462388 [Delitschia confertaspora ATCC 74209]|uniref:Rhodopsin domain-containing protein n=1 Tax=Delitschia confertaspora ATCC 74209 TaxID=1513339 RepID=A0A9P4MTE1_9PLEO|nr:hypothetical protein GQ43DRAFT_462388 [Delitschia confertaspora ATCC 74209]
MASTAPFGHLPQKDLPLSNRISTIYGVGIPFHVIAICAVALRFYVRFKVVRTPGWDDFWIFCSLLSTTAAVIIMCTLMQNGLGQHQSAMSFSELKQFCLSLYCGLGMFCISAVFIKISILCQYLRIFEKGRMRKLCMAVLVITAMWGTAYSFISWVPCFPVRAAWDPDVKGKCYGFMSKSKTESIMSLESHAGTNMLLDIVILMIPMVLLRKKGLSRRQIWGMIGVFSLGAVSCGLAIARLTVIARAFTKPASTNASANQQFDMAFNAPISVLLSSMEVSFALTSSSIPVFWPVLVKLGLGQILLVHEVQITEETRATAPGAGGVSNGNTFRRDKRSEGDRDGSDSMGKGEAELEELDFSERTSIAESERGLRHSSSKTPLTGATTVQEAYYRDAFVATHVNPLKKGDHYRVMAERTQYLEQIKILRLSLSRELPEWVDRGLLQLSTGRFYGKNVS